MRLLAELLVIAALIGVAWEKPYHEWVGDVVPMLAQKSTPTNKARARRALPAGAAAKPSPTISDGSWMWDKNRKGPLDRPEHTPPPPQPAP